MICKSMLWINGERDIVLGPKVIQYVYIENTPLQVKYAFRRVSRRQRHPIDYRKTLTNKKIVYTLTEIET
jgi:hypothetical protein